MCLERKREDGSHRESGAAIRAVLSNRKDSAYMDDGGSQGR